MIMKSMKFISVAERAETYKAAQHSFLFISFRLALPNGRAEEIKKEMSWMRQEREQGGIWKSWFSMEPAFSLWMMKAISSSASSLVGYGRCSAMGSAKERERGERGDWLIHEIKKERKGSAAERRDWWNGVNLLTKWKQPATSLCKRNTKQPRCAASQHFIQFFSLYEGEEWMKWRREIGRRLASRITWNSFFQFKQN